MAIKIICPGCEKTLNAPDEYAGRRTRCPACKTEVTIPSSESKQISPQLEHPPSPPKQSQLPNFERDRDILDYVVFFSIGAIPTICVVGLLCMLFGSSDLLLLLGGVSLLLSLFFLTKYSQLKIAISKGQKELSSAKASLKVRDDDLRNAIDRFTAFQDNYDHIVEKEHERIAEQYKDAEEMYTFARNRDSTIDRLGKRLLNDSVKSISGRLTPNNFTASSDRLRKVVEFCRKHEYSVTPEFEAELLDDLRREFESAVRKQHAKEEQARIKARIREEQKAEKELEKEMRRIEAEKSAIEKALEIALRKAKDQHSEEVELLRQRLLEAEEKSQRAISMAQQTKAGHVYVISNIGSFGEDVFKIGMTRRLEPLDRVKELGDASVPFPFDVHMMISCDDAPSLENTLHKEFHTRRLNKVNLRREFFRIDLEDIRRVVEENHGEVDYVAKPEALQYRESLEMTDEEFSFISATSESLDFEDDSELE